MIILIHVLIAIASVAIATATFAKPSIKKLGVSYAFIVATVGSGTYLLLTSSGNILKSCLVGLAYVTAVSIVTIATHTRVRRQANQEL
ncbi:hypothetical protein BGO18_02035 [Candidatus Saccharibacteria bacterium 47-87]|nr:hypothetical protein [Candidatus Saccharibacteria bacterium]OJU96940.1 MAG: hypothetical protein BGO18_02035 [Candidatus Saccharibacteria bacterium 47-87]